MAKEIVKEILLKFKGDSKPLEREVKNVEKVAANLQKTISGGQSGSAPSQLSKTLDTYIKQSQKFGMTVNKDMTKFQKTIQEVATKDLKVLQKQTDDMFRKTEDRLRRLRTAEQNLQRMRESGDTSSKAFQKQRRKVSRYGAEYKSAAQDFAESAEEFNQRTANQPSPAERRMKGLGFAATAVGATATALAQIPGTIQQMRQTDLGSRALLNETMKQRKMDYYGGNLTEMMLERKDKILQRSQSYADAQQRNETQKRSLLGVGGTIAGGLAGAAAAAWAGAQMGAIGGSFFGPLGTLVGGAGGMVVGGLAGAGTALAASGALPYFFGGGKEAYHEQQRRTAADQMRKMTMNDEYYKYLSERAPARYELQRQTGMGDVEASAFRLGGMANFFNEEQSASTLMALRGTLGNRGARLSAQQAMEVARNQGMSLQTATGLAGTLAMSGTGGAGGVKKTLTDIYTDAFSKGVTDSGLVEVFQKGMADIASRSPDVMDLPSIAARMTQAMQDVSGGRDIGARDIAGAMNAQNALGQFSMQGGVAGFSKMSMISDMFGGDTNAMAFFGNRTDQEIENLIRTGDPRAMNYLKKAGVKPEDFLKNFGPAATFAKTLSTTQAGQSMVDEIKTRLSKGESLADITADMGGQTEVLAGMGPMSKETASQMTMQAIDQLATDDPELKMQLDKARKEAQEADVKKITGNLSTAKTDDEKQRALTAAARRFSSDIDAGRDSSWMQSLPQDQQDMITRITSASRNARPGSTATDGTRAGAQQKATFEGMSELERKATEAISAEDIAAAGQMAAAGAGGSMGLDQSVANLKTALDAFVRAIGDKGGTSSQSVSSGLQPGDVGL